MPSLLFDLNTTSKRRSTRHPGRLGYANDLARLREVFDDGSEMVMRGLSVASTELEASDALERVLQVVDDHEAELQAVFSGRRVGVVSGRQVSANAQSRVTIEEFRAPRKRSVS
jgi:hypothetical protein